MKNMKLGTKIIGMVSILLFLMIISSGFGIIKIRDVGDEIAGIAEEDIPLTEMVTEITVNQLEQAIWLERALRYGEVRVSEAVAKEGLEEAEGEFEKYTLLTDSEFKKAEELAAHSVKNAGTPKERDAFEEIQKDLSDIETHHAEYEEHVHQIFTLVNEGKIDNAEMLAEEVEAEEEALDHELEQFLKKIEEFTEEASLKAQKDELSAVRGMATISVFSVIFGLLMGVFLTRSITRPVNRIIDGLDEGSGQVASASGQISSTSQQLAEGASEQAASIEETSSSLEEMAAMTRQNAENAGEANNLMKKSNQVVDRANDHMAALTASMSEISKASEETSKIIKTIDEIAFQTNLLALNAAVEAARAGDAGAGFAVVADEVRNLAMRAADASKNTAALIEDTIKRVKDGSGLVGLTSEAFTEVAGSTGKIGGLISEITSASEEQAQGIEQINRAVAEMDKVVQLNAANAEESAAASEEMNAQAEQMKNMVAELTDLVNGSRNGIEHRKIVLDSKPKKRPISISIPQKAANGKVLLGNGDVVKPDEIIPMEEDDFTDF